MSERDDTGRWRARKRIPFGRPRELQLGELGAGARNEGPQRGAGTRTRAVLQMCDGENNLLSRYQSVAICNSKLRSDGNDLRALSSGALRANFVA